jgi:N6-L-threonylcarbamoyladenine synthase
MKSEAEKFHFLVYYPSLEYCTDNAAMIARAGYEYLVRGYTDDLSLNVYPSMRIGEKVRIS